VISLSYEFTKHVSDEEIRDTILHEIAHALVGKAHNHDEVWRAKALEMGCTGRRCHDVQFSPPRYIVQCDQGCWVATAERRQRGIICKRCQGRIVYVTYTEERWRQSQEHRQMELP
jgi:predicted SprT family Zn-dependent metalloprotease